MPPRGARTPEERPATSAASDPADVAAIERTDAYRRLIEGRRRFILIAAGPFFALFVAFLALSGWARDWMATRISGGLTVGYAFALLVIFSVWGVVIAYSKISERVFEPLSAEAQEDVGR
jgi:uncharacterized membrane protein (DUF485 family)